MKAFGGFLNGQEEDAVCPDGVELDLENEDDAAWVHALRRMRWKFSSLESFKVRLGEALKHLSEFEKIYGRSPLVRMPEGLFDSWASKERSFREFGVLCAVYSIIGTKKYARINRHDIRQRALGYHRGMLRFSSGNVLPGAHSVLRGRLDGLSFLTLDQVRYTLDRLEMDNLFFRFSPSRRVTLASRSLDANKLALIAAEQKVNRDRGALKQKRLAAKERMLSEVARLGKTV